MFEILSYHANSGSISVRFFLDEVYLDYTVDIPLVNGTYISGEELHNHIMQFYPKLQLERLAALKNTDLPPPSIISNFTTSVSLDQHKSLCCKELDAKAVQIRSAYMTPGMEIVYITKLMDKDPTAMYKYNFCKKIIYKIEDIRLPAKENIRSATSVADVDAIFNKAIKDLKNI